jgi:hypothetical protein
VSAGLDMMLNTFVSGDFVQASGPGGIGKVVNVT